MILFCTLCTVCNPQRDRGGKYNIKSGIFERDILLIRLLFIEFFFLCCIAFLPIDENLHGCGISTQQDLGIVFGNKVRLPRLPRSTHPLARTLIHPPSPPPQKKNVCVRRAGREVDSLLKLSNIYSSSTLQVLYSPSVYKILSPASLE